jgi:hypothetical protein
MSKRLMTFGTSLAAAIVLALLPAAASARLTEIGATSVAAVPSCPASPCLAVSRTTGYEARSGTLASPMVVPRDGKIVAWTISLGKPTAKQIAFFDSTEGGPASAGITIIRPGKKLFYRVQDQSPLVLLQPYFGLTAQFALDRTIPVKAGWVIGLTVPTWSPSLAVGYNNDTSWRASRSRAQCKDTTTQTAQLLLGQLAQYYCLYRTARLTYTATLISTP